MIGDTVRVTMNVTTTLQIWGTPGNITRLSTSIYTHTHTHTHMCKVRGCISGKDGKSPYGNDEQHTVWAHMYNAHNIQSPVSCPKCKAGSLSSKTGRRVT